MLLKTLSSAVLLSMGISMTANAGELIASTNFLKSGCSWTFVTVHNFSFPGGSGSAVIHRLQCNGINNNIATRANVNISNGHSSCNISGVDDDYELTGNQCANFSIREKDIQPPTCLTPNMFIGSASGPAIQALANQATQQCGTCGIVGSSDDRGATVQFHCGDDNS